MNRIDAKFKELRSMDKKAFIAYITAGDRGLTTTKKLVLALEKSGVDIIELGIPFSDPIADGPIIQEASARALSGGVTLKKILGMVRSLRADTKIPIAFMTYYNPMLRYGLEDFFNDCQSSGVDGVIIPDLPVEESSAVIKLARLKNISTILLMAPTSTRNRIKDIAESSTGFIYYVSLTGVTGIRNNLPPDITDKIRAIRAVTKKPVAVGFGVSLPEQAKKLAMIADGVIVGSAIVKLISEGKDIIKNVSVLAGALSKAIHSVSYKKNR